MCSILAISALFAAPKIQLDWLHYDGKKRIQEQKEGESVVSKSRPAMNVSSFLIATSSSAAQSPIASKSPGMSGASGKTGSRMNLEAN